MLINSVRIYPAKKESRPVKVQLLSEDENVVSTTWQRGVGWEDQRRLSTVHNTTKQINERNELMIKACLRS